MIQRILLFFTANLLIATGAQAQNNYYGLSGSVRDCYQGEGTREICEPGNLIGAFESDLNDQREKLEFMEKANGYFLETRHGGDRENSLKMISFVRTRAGIWWETKRQKRLTRYQIKFHETKDHYYLSTTYVKNECTMNLTAEELQGGRSDIRVNTGSLKCKVIDEYKPEDYGLGGF